MTTLIDCIAGLSVQPFQGVSSVQELQCSGDTLPSDADLMSIVLYQRANHHVMSILNLRKRQCSTSGDYVSCVINESDSRKSVVKALVYDLPEGQSRAYGCNVSVLTSKGRFEAVSWSVTAHHQSKSFRWKRLLDYERFKNVRCDYACENVVWNIYV